MVTTFGLGHIGIPAVVVRRLLHNRNVHHHPRIRRRTASLLVASTPCVSSLSHCQTSTRSSTDHSYHHRHHNSRSYSTTIATAATASSTRKNSSSNKVNDAVAIVSASEEELKLLYSDIRSYDQQYINGTWVASTNTSQTKLEVTDSNTGHVIASVPDGTPEDTLRAIAAAKHALPYWSQQVTVPERIQYIQKFLQEFCKKERLQEINHRTIVELGCTQSFTETVQTSSMIAHTKTLLQLLQTKNHHGDNSKQKTFEWEYRAGQATVVKEPIGVVGCITPWNYPVSQIALKVIPALLAGCTVVLKPSEVTPLVAYSITECLAAAQFPPGVVNMVMGTGPQCGEVLVSHPDVALVSFTGSTAVGHRLARRAATTLQPLRLELGGKSATILCPDLASSTPNDETETATAEDPDEYEKLVPQFVQQLTSNSGQSCNALSRMLVPRPDQDRVAALIKHCMQQEVVGDTRRILPQQHKTTTTTNPAITTSESPQLPTMGPLVNATQYKRVVDLIRTGIDIDGATLVCGGDDVVPPVTTGKGGGGGYYIPPTLFSHVTNDMVIAQTEIFGPVLCLIPYDTIEEAIAMTNDTPYGLNNAVVSKDVNYALRVAAQLKSGMVMVNNTYMDLQAPFGGYKQSGNAREWGISGLEEFLITKTINIDIDEYRSIVYGPKSKDIE